MDDDNDNRLATALLVAGGIVLGMLLLYWASAWF